MNEHQLLQACLQEIEKKLPWGDCNGWTNQEFSRLSQIILEKTGISLSVSSLRRLYGKSTDYKKVYNPQLETKNAISKFLGYRDWHDFRRTKTNTPRLNNRLIIGLSIALISIVLVLISYRFARTSSLSSTPRHTPDSVFFSGTNLLSNTIPNTVIINYNIKGYKAPLYIDWDDVLADRSAPPIKTLLENDSGSITHTYYTKDIYKIRLIDDQGREIRKLKSAIYTNGWECYAIQNKMHLIIDSVYFQQDSLMHASEQFLQSKGIDFNKPYRLFYRNIWDHKITGKEFNMEVDFKPGFRDSYVECAHFQAEIIGAYGSMLLTFMKTGCGGEVEAIYLGNKIIDGRTNDLSVFTISNHVWHSLTVNVQTDSTRFMLDQHQIFDYPSPPSIGNIIGIRFEFLGNGRIRNFDIR